MAQAMEIKAIKIFKRTKLIHALFFLPNQMIFLQMVYVELTEFLQEIISRG